MTVKCVSCGSFVSEPASAVLLQNRIIIERVTDPAGAADEVGFAFLRKGAAEPNHACSDGAFIQ